MSENQSPTPPSDSQDVPFQPSIDNVDCSPADELLSDEEANRVTDAPLGSAMPCSEEQTDSQESSDSWETVGLPGTLGRDATSSANRILSPEREDELLTLIHDLNECNDALLARTSQLEGALEATRLALAAEVEKTKAAQAKMASQITAEQVAAQQAAQDAQQQVAKLVSQLDTSEQVCNRQRLINENLQTELNNCQERIVQLEHECAVTTQQHAAEAQARLQAETTSRDLRSRLQRQQRYTLQFKAALEKSLSASMRPVDSAEISEPTQPAPLQEPVPMPRAQRIVPWAAGSVSAFQGIDPHLESLIRGVSKTAEVSATSAEAGGHPTSAADQEAEALLWQDLERVMTASEAAAPAPKREQTEAKTAVDTAADKVAAQSQSHPQPSHMLSSDMAETDVAREDVVTTQPSVIAPKVAHSFAAATGQLSDAETGFIEPSPWGNPLSQKQLEETGAKPDVLAPVSPTGYLPVGTDTTAISPLVKPMRSPKKLSSLSAVQLPTFEKTEASSSSFQR